MSYRQDARSGNKGLRGVMLTSKEYQGKVWFTSWHKTEYQPTMFRPLGPVSEDMTEFLPWRFTTDEQDYGEWIAARRLFRGGTASRITFIADMYDPESGEYLDPNLNANPAYILYDAWKKGKEQHQEWERLEKPIFNKQKGIDTIKTYAVLQGILLAHKGKHFYDEPRLPAMLWLSWSAKTELEELLEEQVENADEITDINKRFACGNVLDADGAGKILVFFNSETDPEKQPSGKRESAQINYSASQKGDEKKKGNKKELAHYMCQMVDEPQALPRTEDGKILFAEQGTGWVPWESALHYMGEEEMVKALVKAYEDMPDLLIYAFEERGWLPDWFYDRVDKNRRRETVGATAEPKDAVPAAPQEGGEKKAGPAASAGKASAAGKAPAINYGAAKTDGASDNDENDKSDAPPDLTPGAKASEEFKGAEGGEAGNVESSEKVSGALKALRERRAAADGDSGGEEPASEE